MKFIIFIYDFSIQYIITIKTMRFLLRFLFTAIAIYFLMYYNYLPGITLVDGTNSLLVFTFILGLVNLVVGGILRLITLPLRILSLGLIGFLISIIVVLVADEFFAGVQIAGWTTVVLVALTMSIVSMILS